MKGVGLSVHCLQLDYGKYMRSPHSNHRDCTVQSEYCLHTRMSVRYPFSSIVGFKLFSSIDIGQSQYMWPYSWAKSTWFWSRPKNGHSYCWYLPWRVFFPLQAFISFFSKISLESYRKLLCSISNRISVDFGWEKSKMLFGIKKSPIEIGEVYVKRTGFLVSRQAPKMWPHTDQWFLFNAVIHIMLSPPPLPLPPFILTQCFS